MSKIDLVKLSNNAIQICSDFHIGSNWVIFYRVTNKVNQNYSEPELTGLIKFDAAKQAIEIASHIDEVKDIRDRAEAFRAYAKQAHFSLGMQNQCAEIKIRAERKAGELLKEMDLHEGGRPTENLSHDVTGFRLCELGINRMQSSRWQQISNIPEEDFEERLEDIKRRGQEITSSDFLSLAGYLQREREREKRREMATEEAKDTIPDDRIKILQGDFREVLKDIPNNSVDLIVTDPIYLREHLDDWADLSLFASRKLKQGKLLVCYSSVNILDESIKRLSSHLQYVWTFAIVYPSTRKPHHPYRINGCWKPLLIFSNGNYQPDLHWINDVIPGDGLTKDHHDWEQPLEESKYIIENLSVENDLILDPFLGSGTTALASKRLNRRFIGTDMDIDAINITLSRLVQT